MDARFLLKLSRYPVSHGQFGSSYQSDLKTLIDIIYFYQGLNIVKVECGSQFSVALSSNGSVYTWGKGDYHRLGHGVDEHVRRPKKVMSLQGKKVVSISTGEHKLIPTIHSYISSLFDQFFFFLNNRSSTLCGMHRPRRG